MTNETQDLRVRKRFKPMSFQFFKLGGFSTKYFLLFLNTEIFDNFCFNADKRNTSTKIIGL